MAEQGSSNIEALLQEGRSFPPPPGFRERANVDAEEIYARAAADPEAYWSEQARRLHWDTPWTTTLEWDLPFARWFVGGTLNASYNCLDRHVLAGNGDRVAYYWEGEPEGESRVIRYGELLEEVSRCANALKSLGVGTGDRVAIYLPMIPELPVAMLACARLGAPHTVVFGGFSATALSDRINDAEAKVLITADGGWRRGKAVPLKASSDEALATAPSIEHVLVVRRTGSEVTMRVGRDLWWHELVSRQAAECPAEPVDSEHMLYLLYTSGTTARPKGIIHTTGGYLTGCSATHRMVFDIKDSDVYWCAADIGWVTGHSYIVYGPLANGCTSVLYEGTPDYPKHDRWWAIVEKYRVSVLYTAPTAIRSHMRWGTEHPAAHDLSSLRLLGSVGEPINPEAWIWYRHHIGGDRCPVVDTWWQTETGSIMISPLPGLTTTRPGSATLPLPGISAEVVDEAGNPIEGAGGGYLVLTKPWPSMLRGIYRDPDRYVSTYWSRFPGKYLAGDGVRRDEDGYFWFLGRIDDVMNVSGHRISTMEVESALVDDQRVAEAAVVGQADPLTGEAIFAYVTVKGGIEPTRALGEELRRHVARQIGAIARPKQILFTPELPKTRSGKIMRRLLRDIANGQQLGDTTTLADASVVETIRDASGKPSDE